MYNLNEEILLTQKLIQFKTINPPGNEKQIAEFIGEILINNGFDVKYPKLSDERYHLIAEKGVIDEFSPIVLCGHLDVVPLSSKKWTVDPFKGEIIDGKIFGRGASDMKSGLAAIICAAIQIFNENPPKKGIRIFLTADEETGCSGAKNLQSKKYNIGKASGLIIAEPTANIPVTGHKGGLFINASTEGIATHSSTPHKGENAIYKAARAISKLEKFEFNVEKDELLGFPTLNVGTIKGGMNFNSVPDRAEFTIDVRLTKKLSSADALQILKKELGEEVKLEPFVNLNACYTDETNAFIQTVYKVCKSEKIEFKQPVSAPYLTDASVIQPWYDNVPTVILGPGQPEQGHQTDEFCYINKIKQAVKIYKKIIMNDL